MNTVVGKNVTNNQKHMPNTHAQSCNNNPWYVVLEKLPAVLLIVNNKTESIPNCKQSVFALLIT